MVLSAVQARLRLRRMARLGRSSAWWVFTVVVCAELLACWLCKGGLSREC